MLLALFPSVKSSDFPNGRPPLPLFGAALRCNTVHVVDIIADAKRKCVARPQGPFMSLRIDGSACVSRRHHIISSTRSSSYSAATANDCNSTYLNRSMPNNATTKIGSGSRRSCSSHKCGTKSRRTYISCTRYAPAPFKRCRCIQFVYCAMFAHSHMLIVGKLTQSQVTSISFPGREQAVVHV